MENLGIFKDAIIPETEWPAVGAKRCALRPRVAVLFNLINRTHKGFSHEH